MKLDKLLQGNAPQNGKLCYAGGCGHPQFSQPIYTYEITSIAPDVKKNSIEYLEVYFKKDVKHTDGQFGNTVHRLCFSKSRTYLKNKIKKKRRSYISKTD